MSTIEEILNHFKVYLNTDEAKKHICQMEQEKKDVADVMQKLSSLDKKSPEFTEWVLYGLLPYSKTKLAKRVSLFPAFMNIKTFFGSYNYSEDDWNSIANKIYSLCFEFSKNSDKVEELIQKFSEDDYSRRLQSGSISPILFSLNDSYPIINNRTKRAYKSLKRILGERSKISQKLANYTQSISKIDELVTELGLEILKSRDTQDLFFYWYDSHILAEERKSEDEDDEETDETSEETEQEIKTVEIDFPSFIKEFDQQSLPEFKPHSLGDPSRIKINELFNNCEKGDWVLPHFQRYFDWSKTDVHDLWESIFNDYYIGSFLLWKTDKDVSLGIQPIKGVNKSVDEIDPRYIVLDGQQRMTSIYYAIKVPDFALKGSQGRLYFYANFSKILRKDAERNIIEIHSVKLPREESFKRMLFPLCELDKFSDWVKGFQGYLLSQFNTPDEMKSVIAIRDIINDKLSHIWSGFEVPYIYLPLSMDLTQVTDVFENLNSKGQPLSVFDLLIARLYKYDVELKKIWDSTRADYENIRRYYQEGKMEKMPIYILQTMLLLHEPKSLCQRKDVLNIYARLYVNNDERDFQEDWDEACELINNAIKKLENMRDGFGVKDYRELPYAPIIPVLAALLKLSEESGNTQKALIKIRKWYWASLFTYSYSSSVDSQMTLDMKEMKQWFLDDKMISQVVLDMTREMNQLDLKGVKSKTNVRYRGTLSLIALEGAKDFDTGQVLENARDNDKDHMFPKSYDFQYGLSKYRNSVLNMTWMSGETNRHIKRAKKPSVYLKELEAQCGGMDAVKELLRSHLISDVGLECLQKEDFEGFIQEREKAIVSKLKALLECADDGSTAERTLITPDSPFSNRMAFTATLKNCTEYILWIDKYFTQKGLELIIQALSDKKDIKLIKILMSVDKVSEQFRSLFKNFKDELKNKNIECHLRVICDSQTKASIHDRFIIAKNVAYNIPSPDVIARSQLSEISVSVNRGDLQAQFEKMWGGTLDIINDWNSIVVYLKP